MTEPFIGEIKMVGFNFAPRGYAFCNGQLISISQNAALFSLLGTTYGGNGTTNFALPDLRGRVPIHFGQGSGLSVYSLGQASGNDDERQACVVAQGRACIIACSRFAHSARPLLRMSSIRRSENARSVLILTAWAKYA